MALRESERVLGAVLEAVIEREIVAVAAGDEKGV